MFEDKRLRVPTHVGVLQEAFARVSVVLCGLFLFAPLFCFACPVFPNPWMLLTPQGKPLSPLCSGSALKQASGHRSFCLGIKNPQKI